MPTVAAAALVGFLFTSLVRRFKVAFTLLDVLSEGLFTVIGVEKALLYHLPYVSAIFLGVITAVGGGLLTDLAAGRPVQVVRGGPWNATSALAGASVYAAAAGAGAPTGDCQAAAFTVVVILRLASLRWAMPAPVPADPAQTPSRKPHHPDEDPPANR